MRAIGVLPIVILPLLVAGCGGNAPTPGVASTASSTTSPSGSSAAGGGSAAAQAAHVASEGVAYSACMRAHGVPGFPDPKVSVHGAEVKVAVQAPAGAAKGNPHFNSAQQACRKLLPRGGPESGHQVSPQEQAQYLKLVACMRSHGLPSLHDPTFTNGQVQIPGGVDHNSPQFKSAEQACQSLIPAGAPGGGS
jgi:hypothetical protein